MAKGASARRHAQAVFQIALERGDLDRWQEDLSTIARVFETPDFKRVLESPKVRLERKLELAGQQLSGVSPLARNLISLLVTKGRVSIAVGIASEYRAILNRYRGVENAEVTTAVSLGDDSMKEIVEQMSRATGKQIILTGTVAPEIIGGIVIRVGDQLIDGSTRTKLSAMRKALEERQI